MTEDELEQLCLDWFREDGWEILHGPDIAPDYATPMRKAYTQVILDTYLNEAFERINKHIRREHLSHCLSQKKQQY